MLRYTLSLDRPWEHLFGVTITLATNGAGHLDLVFPAWSPGRYFIYDFARNVQELEAHGAGGAPLRVEKIAKGTWRIFCAGNARVSVGYRMFGDTLSGTFSQLDDRHAAVNGSSVFGWIEGHQADPIELTVRAPKGWKVFTSMPRLRGGVFAAENYDVLIDSPIEIGTPLEHVFTLDGVGYHVVVDIAGGASAPALRERVDRYLADLQKIVQVYTQAFGRPEFDAYWFLVNIDPFAQNGDGMEHLASTRVVINGSIMPDEIYSDLLAVSSHEFFHIWNVKRLRPAELGPFDYTSERHTTLLWFAEGFTQYYGHLMIRRAGVWDDKQVFKHLVGEINMVDRSPGRFHRNLRLSSFDTWHAAGARNPVAATSNFKNTYVNYYHKGAVIALLLDLDIRRRTRGRRSLDDLVRHLYRTTYAEAPHADYFLRGNGYTERDVLNATEAVAGKGARALLARLIGSVGELDYTRALEHVGLQLLRGTSERRKRRRATAAAVEPQIHTGLIVADARERSADPFVTVLNVAADSPAARAGFSAGDLILALDGERVDGKRWDGALAARGVGADCIVSFFRGARLLTLKLTTEELDTRPYRLESIAAPTDAQKRARAAWLGSE